MRTDPRLLATLLGLHLAGSAVGADRYLLIGGGPTPKDSQVSIEKNVIWIDGMMRARPFASHELLFASGPTGRPDVVLHAPEEALVQRWLPLARLYGEQKAAMSIFRRNEVPNVSAGASEANVAAALGRNLAGLGPGDSLFFVYNGHGSGELSDTSRNALRLWGETRLDVREFGELLDGRKDGATVRAIFPQCYSGGFARSLFKDPVRPDVGAVRPNFCGFYSVTDRVEAEGCTPGIDVGEYRDYSTFFFAALDGKTRLSAPLRVSADTDQDGTVSLAEAHSYAYVEGITTDVPRSSSEEYLERWQPWYTRWQSTPRPGPSNPYMDVAVRLASRLGASERTVTSLATFAISQRRSLERQISKLDGQIAATKEEEQALRKRLLADFQLEWPAAAQPHTAAYWSLVEQDATPMLAWIVAQPQYTRLEALQSTQEALELQRLDLRRRDAAFARLDRALMLATIRENFDRFASDAERRQYDALRQCESWSPPPVRAGRP